MHKITLNNKHNNSTTKEFIFSIKKPYKKYANYTIIIAPFIAALLLYAVAGHRLDTRMLKMVIVYFVIFITPLLVFHFYSTNRKEHIIVNEQGITFNNCMGLNVPKQIKWNDLAKTYLITNVDIAINQTGDQLLFLLADGKTYTFTIKINQHELVINQVSPNSFLEIIALYSPPIERVTTSHQAYKNAIKHLANPDLGKEVGHIAYASILIMVIAIVCMLKTSTILLDNYAQYFWYLITVVIVVSMAVFHMRHIKIHKMIIPILLIGATSAFLILSLASALPKLVGTPIETTFIITAEDTQQQTWQSKDNALLYFTRYISSNRRAYSKDQQPSIKLIVYKTSFGLNAIDRAEYRKLFQ